MTSLSLFEKPAAASVSSGPRLRPYQLEAFAGGSVKGVKYPGIRAALAKHRSTAVILATGLGKTVVAAFAAMETPGRVLFLAHMDTLVSQARSELQAITGQQWDIEQADFKAYRNGSNNVVASVQSLMRPMRLDRWPTDAFSLIIVDEAHHYVAQAFKRPLDHFGAAKILALTATPDRKDRKAMGRYVESVAYKMDLVDGIDAGWLVPVECRPPIELDVTLDDVRTEKGDLNQADLEEKIKQVVAPIAKAAVSYCGVEPTIIFTPRVESAHAAAQRLNAERPGCAGAVDGTMDRAEKGSVVAQWREGRLQFVANCNVLTEGFDFKGLKFMIDAAPTQSRSRCVQKLGRLLRPLADVDSCATAEERKAAIAASAKPKAVWIDLKFNGSKHQLACPTDILGGSYTDQERAKAKRLLEKKGGDPRAALEEARRRIAARAAKAKTKMELGSYDPTRKGAKPVEPAGPPTAGQMRSLARFGVPADLAPTLAEAQKLLRFEYLSQSKGWCDYRQRQWLMAHVGITGKGMSKADAKPLAEHWQRIRRPFTPQDFVDARRAR